MPRTKPQQIKPASPSLDRLGRHRRRRRGQGRAAGGRRVPARPQALPAARRQGARRASCSTGRPAPARRCWPRPSRTSRGAHVLRPVGRLVRRDVRRPRRGAHPPAVRAGAQARAGDHLHRRARRRRRPPRHRTSPARRTRRSTSCWSRWTASARASDVVVIAASNLLEKLDPALLRPGRFDRQIFVVAARRRAAARASCDVHTRDKPLGDVDLELIARQTSGLTGADLANICNEAAIFAARRGARADHRRRDFDSRARARRSPACSRGACSTTTRSASSPTTRPATRCAASCCRRVDRVHKISIVPRGRALGYTLNLPDEDRYLKTREELIDYMTVLLGGRVAEQLVFGSITTGASDDLKRVAEIAHVDGPRVRDGHRLHSSRMTRRRRRARPTPTRRMRDQEQQDLADEALPRRARSSSTPTAPSSTSSPTTLLSTRCSSASDIERIDGRRPVTRPVTRDLRRPRHPST